MTDEAFIKKMLDRKKPETIDEIKSITQDYVDKIPYLKKNTQDMILCRGSILDMAIKEEAVFNEIILLTSNYKSYVTADFQKKVAIIKKVIRIADTVKNQFNNTFYKKLDTLVLIRNLFAHVEIDMSKEVLTFETNEPYGGYFHGKIYLADVKTATKEFTEICLQLKIDLDNAIPEIHKYGQKNAGIFDHLKPTK